MKAKHTNHLFNELMLLMKGYPNEFTGFEVVLRHIQKSAEEIESLENKADKWDEKETPFDVIDFKIDMRRRKIGGCKCNATVVEGDSYCWNCGQKLNWED